MHSKILYAIFILLPFAFISPGKFGAGHRDFFILSALVYLASKVPDRYLKYFVYHLALWMGFLFIGHFNFKHVLPWYIPQYIVANAFYVQMWVIVGLIFYIGIIESDVKKQSVFLIIRCLTIIQCAIGIFQLFGIDPARSVVDIFINTKGVLADRTPTGTLGNNNFWAAWLAISSPFFFDLDKRRFLNIPFRWVYFLPVIFILIFLSNTSTAVLSTAVGMAVLIGKPWWALGIFAIALLYGFFIDTRPIHLSKRWSKWGELLHHWQESWKTIIFGHGPGSHWLIDYTATFEEWAYKMRLKNESLIPHSEWLSALSQYGIIGFSLLIGYAVNIYKHDRVLFSAFIISVVNAIGNHPMHLAPSAFLIIMIAGLSEKEKQNNRQHCTAFKKWGRLSKKRDLDMFQRIKTVFIN